MLGLLIVYLCVKHVSNYSVYVGNTYTIVCFKEKTRACLRSHCFGRRSQDVGNGQLKSMNICAQAHTPYNREYCVADARLSIASIPFDVELRFAKINRNWSEECTSTIRACMSFNIKHISIYHIVHYNRS